MFVAKKNHLLHPLHPVHPLHLPLRPLRPLRRFQDRCLTLDPKNNINNTVNFFFSSSPSFQGFLLFRGLTLQHLDIHHVGNISPPLPSSPIFSEVFG